MYVESFWPWVVKACMKDWFPFMISFLCFTFPISTSLQAMTITWNTQTHADQKLDTTCRPADADLIWICVCVCVCVCVSTLTLCCQIILQKSVTVELRGPWQAMYLLSAVAPCRRNTNITATTAAVTKIKKYKKGVFFPLFFRIFTNKQLINWLMISVVWEFRF